MEKSRNPSTRPYRLRRSTVTIAGLSLALAASGAGAAVAQPHAATPPHGHARTLAALHELVAAGTPGAVVRVDRGSRHWDATVGVANLHRPGPRSVKDHFRIGSVTKTFTAVTLLKLEAEGRLSLSDSVEKWLPGLLDHHGYHPRRITIRQLLDHQSGVADVLANPAFTSNFIGPAFYDHRYRTWTPRQLVELGIANPPLFDPGKGWSYSNTNYSLAQMIIRRASGHSYARAVTRQVLRPAGLHETVVPGTDPALPRPHSRAYSHLFVDSPEAPAYDVTRFNPTLAGAGGEIVSTTHDLNRFFRRLLQGRLLPARQQRELLRTVRTGRDYRYGLGIATLRLPCGRFWGNDGDVFGSVTYTYATRGGRHVITLNTNDNWNDDTLARNVLEAELCRG